MKFEVLYEDNHLIVVNKPAGAIVQADITNDRTLGEDVAEYIQQKYNKPGKAFIGIPHRLDRPTSGIVIFARTSKALTRMAVMFKEREIKKTYWAVVKGIPEPESGRLVNFLRKNGDKNRSTIVPEGTKDSHKAILNYKLLLKLNNFNLIEVDLETGRHHQIRAQLSGIGCWIKGDVKYGANRPNEDKSIHLHARRVEFLHPIQKTPIVIEAPAPGHDAIWKACNEAFPIK